MTDLVIFPDRMDALGEYLAAELAAYGAPVEVSAKTPDDETRAGPGAAGYIRLTLSSIPAGKFTEDVQVIADVYDDEPATAARVAAMAGGVLAFASERMAGAYASRVTNGPYESTDPRTDMARFTVMAQIRFRAETIARLTEEGAQ